MIIAAGFGLGLGTIAGLSVGSYLFDSTHKPKDYKSILSGEGELGKLHLPPGPGEPVKAEMRSLLEFCEPWTVMPDYERVCMINRMLAVLWPSVTEAVMAEVLKVVKTQLEAQVFAKFKFVEDIIVGTQSMKEDGTWENYVKEKLFTIGSVPPRVGGIKCLNTAEDEVFLEVPIVWGSDCQFDLGVFLRAGPLRLYVPLQVANLQIKIETRITLKPLVEEIPCLGGVSITLLKPPHVDLSLKLLKGVDLMALPGVKEGVRFAIDYVLGGMMIYPNAMSFPIMTNYGMSPPPKGALVVTLIEAESLRGDDTYIKLEVRKGRPLVSKNIRGTNSPRFDQEFHFIVDDFKEQSLKMTVYYDDLGWNDTPIGFGELAFGSVTSVEQDPETGEFIDHFEVQDFIKIKGKTEHHDVLLEKPFIESTGVLATGKTLARFATKPASKLTRLMTGKNRDNILPQPGSRGTLRIKVRFESFAQQLPDDLREEQEALAKAKAKPAAPLVLPPKRVVNHDILDDSLGVLTVNLVRCINLMGEDPTVYVRMLVVNEKSVQDLEQRSSTVFSENSPRWGTKFDYVMIRADSELHIIVYHKASAVANLLTAVNVFSKKKAEQTDKVLGKLQIPVKDIARNGSLKDIWTLEDTERGSIELALTWQTCHVPDS